MFEESQRFCELGEEHLRREQPEEALQCYERAVREDPLNPAAWSGRAKACYQMGQLERADRYFRRAQRMLEPKVQDRRPRRGMWGDPAGQDYLRLLHWRGLCRFWMGMYEEAGRMFRRVLKLAPSDPLEVRFLIGESWFRMGELDKAIREFEAAGDDPDAMFNLGLAWFYKGEFERSVNAFRRGIFENVFLACRLAEVEPPSSVPAYRGTHPKQLDSEEAAAEYYDRCGDLWQGRPLLLRWLRTIYLHPVVQQELAQHLEQLSALAAGGLAANEVARLEGANAVLRSPVRIAQSDRTVTEAAMRQVFRLPR